MEEKQVMLLLQGTMAAAAGFTCLVFLCIGKDAGTEEKVLGAYREFAGLVRAKTNRSGLYQSLNAWLVKKGAGFHYGNWIDPMWFVALSLVIGVVAAAILAVFGIFQGLVGGILLAAAPTLLLLYMDRGDTEKQLPELKLVYLSLEIQVKAGVYVTDALAECYGSVREPRLKAALLDLAGDIVMKADVFESLEKFQSKFDNRYIDSLCIIILQALESGQAVELLKDIGEQIKDMEESILERKKAALDRTITFCQLGVLTVVLALALYACIIYMFGAARFF
ncbi:MAG: type II secretion system F family protein [Acetatifactor sp.]|nr:type II secretion system F family protein [Acetatifactor sp.]